MTRMVLVVMLILFSISSVNFVDSLQESLGKFLGAFGAKQQYRIIHIAILNAKEKKEYFITYFIV